MPDTRSGTIKRSPTVVEVSSLNPVRVENLWYATGRWSEPQLQIPAWAQFMVRCGCLLARADPAAITVGVSVPTRGYAAAFAAAGVTIERDVLEPMAPNDLELHLATLRETASGTPIKYHAQDQIYDGRWLEIAQVGGEEMLCFETKQRVTRKLRLSAALSIRLTGETTSTGPLRAKRVKAPPLLEAILGESGALTFMTTARADCLLVGTQTLLEEDLTSSTFFATGDSADASGGTLQDVVRARELPGAHRYYRTVIVPSASGPSAETRSLLPQVIVFDGARAYVRWRHLWPAARQLVIIDRSSPSADEAAYELSMAFAERKADSPLLGDLRVPAGVEAISFERQA